VLGGVLDDHPRLRVCLAHGCGTFPWALPRLARGASMGSAGVLPGEVIERARSLWCDSLVFEASHLPVLFERFGADHVVLGSDFPFYPPTWGGPTDILEGAIAGGLCSDSQAAAVCSDNGWRFLGARSNPSHKE